MTSTNAFKKQEKLNHVLHNENYWVSSMTPLAKETEVGLRKNQNIRVTRSLNLDHSLEYVIASIVVPITSVDSPAFGKICKTCCKKKNFAKKCCSGKAQGTGGTKHKSFKYQEVNLDQESSDDQIDEITSTVKPMYYHDVHFNSVNTRMHINLNMRSCNGNSMKTHLKVDTGADGNLLPLGEFFKHFPEANLNDLAKTVCIQ